MSKIIYKKTTGEIAWSLQCNDPTQEDALVKLNTPPNHSSMDSKETNVDFQKLKVDVATKTLKVK